MNGERTGEANQKFVRVLQQTTGDETQASSSQFTDCVGKFCLAPIRVLDVPGDYQSMDPELVASIRSSTDTFISVPTAPEYSCHRR
jgi:hypothetical protein